MVRAILRFHYPRGVLPVEGFRCTICSHEVIDGDEVARAQEMARKLGLYGLEGGRVRRLLRTGGSLAVTLDPHLLRHVLGHAKAGTSVRVGLDGHRIVIEAV